MEENTKKPTKFNIKKMSKKHLITAIVAIALVLAIIFVGMTHIFAYDQGVYISDVRLAYGDTADEAKQKLIDEGYEVLDTNLLYNSKTSGKKYEYIGYKTTSEERDAITDIRLMNMNSGYKTMDYRALMESLQTNLTVTAQRFQNAVLEVKANVKARRPLALVSKEMLDMFVYDGVSLSDYLFDESRTLDEFQDLILICNSAVITSVYSIIGLGVTDDNSDTFAKRFTNGETFAYSSAGEYEEADKKYWDIASDLSGSLLTFCENYQKAVEIYGIDGSDEDEFNDLDVEVDGDYDKSLRKDENVMEYILEQDYSDLSSDDQNYLLYLGVYNILQKYDAPDLKSTEKFGKPTNLAEYIVAFGNGVVDSSELTDDEIRYLYPLMAAFTAGQLGSISVNGWINTFLYLGNNTSEMQEKIQTNYEKYAVSRLEDSESEYVNDKGQIDVFVGTRRDLFDTEIALTSEANMKTAAANDFAKLNETGDNLDSDLKYAMLVAGMAGAIAAGTACVVFAVINLAVGGGFGIASAITGLVLGCTWMTGACATGLLVGCILGVAFVGIAILAAVAVIVCLIWKAIHKKQEAAQKQKELEESEKPIPTVTVDCSKKDGASVYTIYYVVTDLEGNSVDATEQKYSWDALYYSKDEAAGTPLRVNEKALFVSSDQGATPENMRPLARFGQSFSANWAEAQSVHENLFLYYYSEGSVEGTEGGSAEQNETYLRKIKVFTNKDEDAVKLEILKGDLQLLDVDLTPGSSVHTYLGYDTTHIETEAIRDIRLAYGSTIAGSDQVNFGVQTYAVAGEMGNGYYLCYSSNDAYASPIYADLFICSSHSDAPEGYEPVNCFSGGDACDLYGSKNSISEGENHRYLYFHPKEMFTGEKQYVSGISFVNSTLSDTTKLNDFVSTLGWSFTDVAGTTDICSNATESGKTYITISYTANPYRAISDVLAYTASQGAYSCGDFLGVGGKKYAVCETYIQSGSTYKVGYTNAYLPRLTDENGQQYKVGNYTMDDYNLEGKRVKNEEGTFDWIAPRTLYVCGTTDNGQDVLTKDDILFSLTENSVDGYRPVTDIADLYSDKAKNLTFEYSDAYVSNEYRFNGVLYDLDVKATETTFKTHLYMHIKGDKVERGKYISGIYVSSDATQGYSDDNAIFGAVQTYGKGELIHYNIAKKSNSQSYVENSDGTVTGTDISGNTSYLYVTYTNTDAKALRDVVIYRVESKDTVVSDTMSINGATYNKCGNIVNSPNGYYYLYSSTNGGTGYAITDVLVDSDWLTSGYKTVVDYDGKINTNDPYRIKVKYDTEIGDGESAAYVNRVKVAFGSSKEDCLKQLFEAGCTNLVDRNKNAGIDGAQCVYFGYNVTNKRTDKNIITGLDLLVSDTAVSDLAPYEKNGVTYTCAETRNLNEGVGGKYIYFYTTTDTSLHPLSKIDYLNLLEYEDNVKRNGQYWFETSNLADGTKYSSKLYYKNTENWSYANGVLTLDYQGNMPDFDPAKKFYYMKSVRVRKSGTLSYLPEWSAKGKLVKSVVINEQVTSLDNYAFYGLTAVKKVTVKNRELEIPDGVIPNGATIACYFGSKAHEYYKANYEEDNLTLELFSETLTDKVNDSVSFKLEDNVLTFSGTGSAKADENYGNWYSILKSKVNNDEVAKALVSQITTIVIEKGITEVPDDYFDNSNLEFTSLKTIKVENPECSLTEKNFPNVKGINYQGYFNSAIYDYQISIAATDTKSSFTPIAESSGKITTKSSWMYSNGVLAFTGTGTAKNFDFKGTVDTQKITTIYIEKGIKSFSANAFAGYTSLKTVAFVDSVNTLKASVKVGVSTLPSGIFENCTALESITLPTGITRIEEKAFYGCSALKKVDLSEGIAYIGKESFCTDSAEFELSVMNSACEIYAEDESFILSSGTLYGATGSTAETYYNSIAEKNPPFKFCVYQAKSVSTTSNSWKVENGVLTLTESFEMQDYDSENLPPWANYSEDVKEIVVENGITRIGSYSFADMKNVEKVTIPETVTEVGAYAFSGCSSLTKIIFNGEALTFIGENALPSNESLKVYCPENSTTWQTVEQTGVSPPVSIKNNLTSSVFGSTGNILIIVSAAGALALFTGGCVVANKVKKSKKKEDET